MPADKREELVDSWIAPICCFFGSGQIAVPAIGGFLRVELFPEVFRISMAEWMILKSKTARAWLRALYVVTFVSGMGIFAGYAGITYIEQASIIQPSTATENFPVRLIYKGKLHFISVEQARQYDNFSRVAGVSGLFFVPLAFLTIMVGTKYRLSN